MVYGILFIYIFDYKHVYVFFVEVTNINTYVRGCFDF